MVFRTRGLLVRQRTQTVNTLRGHLAEFSLVAPRGVANVEQLWEAFAECAESIPELVVSMAGLLFDRIDELNAQLDAVDQQMRSLVREDEELRRLMTIPGVGEVGALAVHAFAPAMESFARGRDFAAWIGLTPREISTAGRQRLGRITKMAQRDLRQLLVLGATSVIRHAHPVYAFGLTRCSSSFCIFASRSDLRRAAELRPELYGAHDNWRYLDALAPEATAVVDFYHGAEQLKSALDARYGENDARGRAQFHKLRHLLLEDPDGVAKVIRALDYQRKKFPRRTRIGEVLRYFRRNRHRMRYADTQARHLPIGSGVVEATSKTLVTQRLKRSGNLTVRWPGDTSPRGNPQFGVRLSRDEATGTVCGRLVTRSSELLPNDVLLVVVVL